MRGLIPVPTLRGGGTRLLPRSEVLYLQAHGDYVRIVSADGGRYLLRSSLGIWRSRWSAHGFVRVHRRYVVNLRRAVEVRPQLNGTAALSWPTAPSCRSPAATCPICCAGCACERPRPWSRTPGDELADATAHGGVYLRRLRARAARPRCSPWSPSAA